MKARVKTSGRERVRERDESRVNAEGLEIRVCAKKLKIMLSNIFTEAVQVVHSSFKLVTMTQHNQVLPYELCEY